MFVYFWVITIAFGNLKENIVLVNCSNRSRHCGQIIIQKWLFCRKKLFAIIGATTLFTMALSIMTLSITAVLCLVSFMLFVANKPLMLSVVATNYDILKEMFDTTELLRSLHH